MKIGLIGGEFPPMVGGVGDFTRELAWGLANLGHEVHVITRVGCGSDEGPLDSRSEKTRASQDTEFGLNPAIHPVISHWGWFSHGRIMDISRRLALHVLNIQYQAAAFDMHPAINFMPWRASLWPSRRESSTRPHIIATFHDLKVPYLFPKAGPLRDWVVTFLARQADAAIVTNREDELALKSRGVDRVARIPIGSNVAPALSDDHNRNTWRADRKIPPESFLLGFFGFFNARKGIETLLRALAILQAESRKAGADNFRLLFIGGTIGSSDATNRAYADRVKALIAELGLSERVHHTGYLPATEISAAFASIDLCVLPYADGISFHHGTLMAALAHSQPIVSTYPPNDLPELEHGENVWLVPPEDPAALAAAIADLASTPEQRQRMRQGAARLAAQFSWDRIADLTATLFESVSRET